MTEQLSLDLSRRRRDAAVQRVAGRANAHSPGWTDVALQFLCAYARQHALFSSEDVTDAAKAWGMVMPHDARAWGPVYLRAQRAGIVERSNVVYQRKYGHASLGVKWRSLLLPAGGTDNL